jgi:cell division GTPase FtsZ
LKNKNIFKENKLNGDTMGAVSITEEEKSNEVIDDISNVIAKQEDKIDMEKLAALKAKKESKMPAKIIAKKERSYSLGIISSGQCGSKLGAAFFSLGYDAIAINTAIQDLKYVNIPDSNKLLLEHGPGGAAKELEIGKAAAEKYRGEITNLINDKLKGSDINIFCTSLGGGSGAGSCETIIDILSEIGKPIVVITVLPMDTEDPQTKSNSLETLVKLTGFAQTKKINNLIIVDNAKLESIYQNISQIDFYDVANKAIVEPIDMFNTLSAMPSSVKGLDPLEFSKILIDGEGLSIYGELIVENYEEDTAIAEAVINNLNGNLLAGGFDLKQSKYVGIIIAANKDTWTKIPSSSITYAMAMVNDLCGNPKGVFKGIYTIETSDPVVKVYSMFSGLGLPDSRIAQLKKEVQEHSLLAKNKDEQRNISLKLDTGTNETVSAAQKIKDKIAAKSSAFGKLVGGIVDKRR